MQQPNFYIGIGMDLDLSTEALKIERSGEFKKVFLDELKKDLNVESTTRGLDFYNPLDNWGKPGDILEGKIVEKVNQDLLEMQVGGQSCSIQPKAIVAGCVPNGKVWSIRRTFQLKRGGTDLDCAHVVAEYEKQHGDITNSVDREKLAGLKVVLSLTSWATP